MDKHEDEAIILWALGELVEQNEPLVKLKNYIIHPPLKKKAVVLSRLIENGYVDGESGFSNSWKEIFYDEGSTMGFMLAVMVASGTLYRKGENYSLNPFV